LLLPLRLAFPEPATIMAHSPSISSATTPHGAAVRQWQSEAPADSQAGIHWACALGATQGRLNLLKPGCGIEIKPNAAETINLLGVEVTTDAPHAPQLVDSWVRSTDAFAIYEPTDSRRLRTTAQWRLLSPDAAGQSAADQTAAIELVVSNQTSRVTSAGSIASTCLLPAADLRTGWFLDSELHLSETEAGGDLQKAWAKLPPKAICCLLCPAPVVGGSLGLLIRRDEARHLFLDHVSSRGGDAMIRVTTWLFPTCIEKGVLHRGRMRAILGSPAAEQHWIAAAAAVFAAEPPLLQ
jgi:hypothetical protein